MSWQSVMKKRREAEANIKAADTLLTKLTPTNPCRTTTPVRKQFLLTKPDLCFYNGDPYTVKWKSLGSGVWEAYLERNKP
jgi:hypothetical protein